jgi:ABC-type proline/glycine betaine transport system permease subunit
MLRGLHLGAAGGPLWLLLLPKCPLCLMPILASVGIAVVPTAGWLQLAAGLLAAGWLGVVLYLGRRHRAIMLTAVAVAGLTALAITVDSRLSLSVAAMTMAGVGLWASRACAADACEQR